MLSPSGVSQTAVGAALISRLPQDRRKDALVPLILFFADILLRIVREKHRSSVPRTRRKAQRTECPGGNGFQIWLRSYLQVGPVTPHN